MPQLFVLFEAATGYAIFRTTEFEEIGVFVPQVRESILNISKFRSNVFFVAYQPFTDKENALLNLKSCSKGELCLDLQLFLENNVPRTKKSKQPVVLGIIDPGLAEVISDRLGIQCISSGVVMEIIRGIRLHFHKLVKGLEDEDYLFKSQLALGNSFAREKVNIVATRQDSMIIESNNLIDDYEKGIKKLGKGIRTRYSIHFPELFPLLQENIELYVQCVQLIGDRKNMPEDIKEQLQSLLGESFEVDSILTAAHNSMGIDISVVDLQNIQNLCQRITSLIKRCQSTKDYLKNKMHSTAPNISAVVGEMIGSRLISRAGGLEKLAKLPASTVQVLGAGKNFFRTLSDSKEKAPISGLISDSSAMKRCKRKKGHMARILANKTALAARVDCFSKVVKEEFGGQLIEEVAKCVKYSKKARLESKRTE